MLQIIIYIATLYICLFALLRYDIQMFQGNSYRYSRYFRWWWGGNILTHSRWWFIAVALGSLNLLAQMVTILLMWLFFYRELTTKYKTPIVYTPRVRRLFVASFLLLSLLVGGLWLGRVDIYIGGIILAFIPLLSNWLMLLANLVNTPIERAITRWYINDAKRIISSHTRLTVIGVTGSYGKTSTKNYLHRLLSERYNVLITPGNYNTLLGVVKTIRESLRPQHQIFIVEMGAKQRGDIKEICDLVNPTIGIISSVGSAHLETFGSIENIQMTKFELVNSLPKSGLGVINFDSDGVHTFGGITSEAEIVRYSIEREGADYRATNVNYNSSGVSFNLKLEGDKREFSSPLLGGGNVLNLTAAIVVANHLKVPTTKIQAALTQIKPVEHRLSMRKVGSMTILDDAYNSNPDGARMALSVLSRFDRPEGGLRIVITPGFVEMGEMQFEANREFGRQIAKSCDFAIVVNELNREAIHKGLCDEGFPSEKIYLADSLNDARTHLSTLLTSGDVVLYENDLPDTFK
ncbi:MAG: UDP-N-acetylmuramoyl-tripeptide--D-alanyl-D-alanine ligase [Rikenellaceae bacterium]